jgi:hypothetical protein
MQKHRLLYIRSLVVAFVVALTFFESKAQTKNEPPPTPKTFGQLTVRGEAGPGQKFPLVKAVQCAKPQAKARSSKAVPSVLQRSCLAPIYFELNTAQTLPAGQYILGFENTIYPGLVEVPENREIFIDLVKIEVPSQWAREKQVRIYRDFSSLLEQRKVYLSVYYTGAHFFRQTRYSFGDYYITGQLDRDYFHLRTFKSCSNLWSYAALRAHARFVCTTWNTAKSMMDMADLFRFDPTGGPQEGTFQEALYFEPGDVQSIRHGKDLVGVPMEPSAFVSVFPGVYRMSVDGKNIQSLRIETEPVIESYPEEDTTRDVKAMLKLTDSNPDFQTSNVAVEGETAPAEPRIDEPHACLTANMWRTEHRSYCTSDKAEGCDRSLVTKCEPMGLDLRFRK